MRKWVIWSVLLLGVFLLGAKTTEIQSIYRTTAYQVQAIYGSGKVQVYFVDKIPAPTPENPDAMKEILRCGSKINTIRARELAQDLVLAADDADGTENR